MDISQRFCYLEDIAGSIRLRQATFSLEQICQRTTFGILHHIISRTVFLKDIVNTNDMGMVEPSNVPSLLQKLLTESGNSFTAPFRTKCHMTGAAITIAEFLHEELLDSHFSLQSTLHSQIGYTETSLTKHTYDSVFTVLQI